MERLNPTRSLTHQPLVQVMFTWANFPGRDGNDADLALGDLQVTPVPVDTRTARMDLLLFLGERWTSARACRDRRDGGISHRCVRRGQHRGAHRAVAAGLDGDDPDPTRRLSTIDLLDDAEHARMDAWANRQTAVTRAATTPASSRCCSPRKRSARPKRTR